MVRPRASSAGAADLRTYEPVPDPRSISDESSLDVKMGNIEDKINSMHARKVLSKLRPSTNRVLKSHNILNNIIHRHGGAIHKSWLGKIEPNGRNCCSESGNIYQTLTALILPTTCTNPKKTPLGRVKTRSLLNAIHEHSRS